MIDHLTMAREFLDEQLSKRNDIVAAYVYGSVARGEASESSDIDLAIVIDGESDSEKRGSGVDGWRDGTYIEASLSSRQSHEDPEEILRHPYRAVLMYDAVIIHDPTGFLTAIHQKVRAAFMEKKWLHVRVEHWLDSARKALPRFSTAIESGDGLRICAFYFPVMTAFFSVPLLMARENPSTARLLTQLGEIRPDLRDRLCELQGSDGLEADDLRALLPLMKSILLLNPDRHGQAGEYWLKKLDWMIEHDLYGEAVKTMWLVGVSAVMSSVENNEDSSVCSAGADLSNRWLRAVNWEGADVLQHKLETVRSLMVEMEGLAAR